MIRFDMPLDDPPPTEGFEGSEYAEPTSIDLVGSGDGPRIALDPENVSDGLGKLVLTLVEVIRQVLEKQAVRRIEAGSLTQEEIERLGVTFLRLSEEMTRLREHFGVDADDLNLDLGPLGKLL